MNYKDSIKFTAKVSFLIISRVVASVAIGIVLNIVLIFMLTNDLRAVSNKMMTTGYTVGGSLSHIGSYLLVIVLLGIIFPVAYFILGKRHGVRTAAHYLFNTGKDFILTYFFDKFQQHMAKQTNDNLATPTKTQYLKSLPEYLQKLHNFSWTVRIVFRFFINKLKFGDLLNEIIESGGENPTDEALIAHTKERLSIYIKENFFVPQLKWLWILSGINIAVFAILEVSLG